MSAGENLGKICRSATRVQIWVWLRFRPRAFTLDEDGLEVVWPLKRRDIPRDVIREARLTDRHALRRDLGWGFRVGAGGL